MKSFILEICRSLLVNIEKQSLVFLKSQTPNQKSIQINIEEKSLQLQLKNDHESLVFTISDEIQKLKDDDIQLQPLVYVKNPEKQEDAQDDIKPLIAPEEEEDKEMEQAAKLIQKKFRQKKKVEKEEKKEMSQDDDIQPLIANQKQIQEHKSIVKREAYQGRIDYDEAVPVEQVDENILEDKELEDAAKKIQKTFKKKQMLKKKNASKNEQSANKSEEKSVSLENPRKLQEKFTIKIESED